MFSMDGYRPISLVGSTFKVLDLTSLSKYESASSSGGSSILDKWADLIAPKTQHWSYPNCSAPCGSRGSDPKFGQRPLTGGMRSVPPSADYPDRAYPSQGSTFCVASAAWYAKGDVGLYPRP